MVKRLSDTPDGRRQLAWLLAYLADRHTTIAKRAQRYESFLSDRRKLKAHLLITYRGRGCRCELLHVISTPDGVLIGHPPRRPGVGAGRPGAILVGREREAAGASWLADGDDDEAEELRCPHVLTEITFGGIRADLASTPRGATIPLTHENMR